MTDREQVKALLADLIVARIVKSDFRPDVSKLDADDVELGLTGYATLEGMEARDRCTDRLIEQAAAWLDSDSRGVAMLDQRVEEEAELDRDIAAMNAREERSSLRSKVTG